MERKLASVQEVLDIEPIENADFIEKIKVLGWNLVSKKGEFKKGDKCVYFEIDSLLPDLPMFEFVKRGSTRDSALRLRTVKLRKVISQGLALPLKTLNEFDKEKASTEYDIGEDVSELIGVTQWVPRIARLDRTDIKGAFPHFVPRTHESRIQSNPEILKEFHGKLCYISVKLDGTSITYCHKDDEFDVCSRNYRTKKPDELRKKGVGTLWRVAEELDIEEKLKKKGNFAVQGELCGPGIQGNRMVFKDQCFNCFNVYDIDNQKYLSFDEFFFFCKELDIDTVPILTTIFNFKETVTLEDLLELAEGKYFDTHNEREGIVIRPIEECYSEELEDRLSMKIISNRFLLKNKD